MRIMKVSSTGVSSVPDRSLSSRFLANLYGLAVNASLFLVLSRAFFLVFSAFRRDFSCVRTVSLNCEIKLMKGKALRKHSLHEKTAASVLLKLFISGNE